jgi:hypothetical protein
MMYATASALITDCFLQMRKIVPQGKAEIFGCRDFVLKQMSAKPDMLNLPFLVLALLLNLLSLMRTCTLFFRLPPERRSEIIGLWKKLPGPGRDFLLFFDTLTALYIFSELPAEVRQ